MDVYNRTDKMIYRKAMCKKTSREAIKKDINISGPEKVESFFIVSDRNEKLDRL
jgi:hypothetical protein